MRLTDHPKIVAKTVLFLTLVYHRVNWKPMSKASSTPYDIFQHRLRVAANTNSIPAFLSKLCNGLDLQAPSIPADLIEYLEFHADLVLMMIREWSQYFVYRASLSAKALKKGKKREEIIQNIINTLTNQLKNNGEK